MERIVFMGTPRFGQLILEALIGHYEIPAVVTQPDREAGRGRRVTISPVKALALAHNLPVLQPVKVRQPEFIQQLRALTPAAIVVAAFGQILPPAILSLPPHGCINVHASLLPHYRGAAPIPAAILAGDAQTGVTIMLMDEGLDTGQILGQAALEILPDDTTASLTERLGRLGGRLVSEILPRWLAGEITPQKQDERLATYSKLLRKEDGRVRWNESAGLIARKCRAFHPWPGMFTFWGKQELKVLRARPCLAPLIKETPGRVVRVNSEIAVVTGEGLLILEEVQLAGKRPLTAREFVRGQRDFVGSLLT
ncbi:MAG: methionyl-tRNA formyltransferase [Anaerolineae bacterium]